MMFGGPSIVELVEHWQPARWYRHEKKFEKDLAEFLREELPDTTVRTQGRQRIDIRVGEELGIELKRKLTPTKVDRLIGQLERYEFPRILVVVCGSSENAWEILQEQTHKYRGGFGEKRVATLRKEKEDLRSSSAEEEQDLLGSGGRSEGLFGLG